MNEDKNLERRGRHALRTVTKTRVDEEAQEHSLYEQQWKECCNKIIKMLEETKMTINKTLNAGDLTLTLAGRLDTTTAPQLEAELKTSLNDVSSLTMDFDQLEYISSAGLRVLLSAQKVMNKQGKMVIRHVNETILEVFEVTGFSDILTIE